MVGELFITFCERSIQGAMRALEIWSYPDSTLNVVVASENGKEKREASFPCSPNQLQKMLDGRRLTLENGSEVLRIQRLDEFVSAEYHCPEAGWRQCVEADALQDAVDRLTFMSFTAAF